MSHKVRAELCYASHLSHCLNFKPHSKSSLAPRTVALVVIRLRCVGGRSSLLYVCKYVSSVQRGTKISFFSFLPNDYTMQCYFLSCTQIFDRFQQLKLLEVDISSRQHRLFEFIKFTISDQLIFLFCFLVSYYTDYLEDDTCVLQYILFLNSHAIKLI